MLLTQKGKLIALSIRTSHYWQSFLIILNNFCILHENVRNCLFLVTTTSLPKPTNSTRRKDLQNADSESSTNYLSIILPIFAVLILLGIVGTIFFWKRHNKDNNVATPDIQMQDQVTERYASSKSLSSPVTSKTTTNPIYESKENAGYEHDSESEIEMHTTADNALYEPSNELFEENPLYQATEYDDDSTYAKPNE